MRRTTMVVAVAMCVLTCLQTRAAGETAAMKSKLAILDLTVHNKMPDDEIDEVTSRLYEELKKTERYEIIERSQVQTLGPDYMSCSDAACAATAGRMLAAQKVVFGNVTKVEIIYQLTLTIVDVASGAVERTHMEKVAGNMNDVAKVGAMCAVQSLHEEQKTSDYKKGDWKKIRGQGVGGRIHVVLPSHVDSVADQIPIMPTLGFGVHWDAKFRTKRGSEIHYTPSIEYWMQEGNKASFMRFEEFAFNVADFRYFFGAPVDKPVVFYLGVGPAFVLNIIYDPEADGRWPRGNVYDVNPKFAANAMAGVETMLKRSGLLLDIGFKAKFWGPSVFELGFALTKPLHIGKGAKEQEETDTASEDSESPAPASETDFPE